MAWERWDMDTVCGLGEIWGVAWGGHGVWLGGDGIWTWCVAWGRYGVWLGIDMEYGLGRYGIDIQWTLIIVNSRGLAKMLTMKGVSL